MVKGERCCGEMDSTLFVVNGEKCQHEMYGTLYMVKGGGEILQ